MYRPGCCLEDDLLLEAAPGCSIWSTTLSGGATAPLTPSVRTRKKLVYFWLGKVRSDYQFHLGIQVSGVWEATD